MENENNYPFKVGDRILVREIPKYWASDGGSYPLKLSYPREFTIKEIGSGNGLDFITTEDGYGFDMNSLLKVSTIISSSEQISLKKKTIMEKLNIMMKKILDKDMKTLIKAGYVNGDLLLTEEGRISLQAIVFEENKEELVKLAEERIAELKEEREENK